MHLLWFINTLHRNATLITYRHIRRLMPSYRFVLGITLFTVLFTVVGMASGGISPTQQYAWPLSAFSGLFNMYVFMLAWCYTPVGNEYTGISLDTNNLEMQGERVAHSALAEIDLQSRTTLSMFKPSEFPLLHLWFVALMADSYANSI